MYFVSHPQGDDENFILPREPTCNYNKRPKSENAWSITI